MQNIYFWHELISNAMAIAHEHAQTKENTTYIIKHIKNVVREAQNLFLENEVYDTDKQHAIITLGWLHEIVEDKTFEIEQIKSRFPEVIYNGIIYLIRGQEDKKNHIVRLKSNAVAKYVKIGDLLDAYSLSSIDFINKEWSIIQSELYLALKSYNFLLDKISKEQFLEE